MFISGNHRRIWGKLQSEASSIAQTPKVGNRWDGTTNNPRRRHTYASFRLMSACVGSFLVASLMASSQAGILAIQQIAERGDAALKKFYTDIGKVDVKCSHRRKFEGHGGFLFRCSSAVFADQHLWFAFTLDGEHVKLAPVSESAARFLTTVRTGSSQPIENVSFVSELTEPLASEIKAFIRSGR